jgi:putative addiction module component (TIGR02574 family)
MATSLLKSALKLSKSERILLVEQIWDSIASEQDAPELTDAQKKELDYRLDSLERNGSRGSTWTEVKKRIRQRRR